jgi:hypothetical protein
LFGLTFEVAQATYQAAVARWRADQAAAGHSHFNEVTLESSVAPSGRAAGLRAAKAIASISREN